MKPELRKLVYFTLKKNNYTAWKSENFGLSL